MLTSGGFEVLTDRRARILGFLVDEYVGSVQPVGSHTLTTKYGLQFSPATVRNEMVRLEEGGYIAQPHTSAGRIPSDKGYRYYVETLMGDEELPLTLQQTIRHQFHQAAQHLEEWGRLAANILAHESGNLAMVMTPHSREARLRSLELVPMHGLVVMLITVLQGARVRQQMIQWESPMALEDVATMAQKLNLLYSGLTATEIRNRSTTLSPAERIVATALMDQMVHEEKAHSLTVFDGLRQFLQQPEFERTEQVTEVLTAIEEYNLPNILPMANIPEKPVTIIIGSEHPEGSMRRCSLVVARYGGRVGVEGAVAILGPTRMNYPHSVSMVKYTASLIGELLDSYFV